jgi:hypothetical protein
VESFRTSTSASPDHERPSGARTVTHQRPGGTFSISRRPCSAAGITIEPSGAPSRGSSSTTTPSSQPRPKSSASSGARISSSPRAGRVTSTVSVVTVTGTRTLDQGDQAWSS